MAKTCLLIRDIIEEKPEADPADPIILKLTTKQLGHILEHCRLHEWEPSKLLKKPLESDELEMCGVEEVDIEFLSQFDIDQLISLLKAAEYINNPYLQDLLYARLALDVKRLSPQKLFQLHGLDVESVTEDEFLKVQKEYQFLIADMEQLVAQQLSPDAAEEL